MDLILKVKELISLVRSNDWLKAVVLGLEILTIITKAMDGNAPRPFFAQAPSESSAQDLASMLAAEVEHAESPDTVQGGLLGPIILPLILALLKKLLMG